MLRNTTVPYVKKNKNLDDSIMLDPQKTSRVKQKFLRPTNPTRIHLFELDSLQ